MAIGRIVYPYIFSLARVSTLKQLPMKKCVEVHVENKGESSVPGQRRIKCGSQRRMKCVEVKDGLSVEIKSKLCAWKSK